MPSHTISDDLVRSRGSYALDRSHQISSHQLSSHSISQVLQPELAELHVSAIIPKLSLKLTYIPHGAYRESDLLKLEVSLHMYMPECTWRVPRQRPFEAGGSRNVNVKYATHELCRERAESRLTSLVTACSPLARQLTCCDYMLSSCAPAHMCNGSLL